jgi:hypothetical protein
VERLEHEMVVGASVLSGKCRYFLEKYRDDVIILRHDMTSC